jgi:WD40 repeat protein
VQIWDTATGRERAALSRGPVTAAPVIVAPDGSWYAGIGEDGKMRIWDAATGQERATLNRGSVTADSVTIAPDGSWYADIEDGKMRIWDAAGQERGALTVRAFWLGAVVIAPDSTWLATANSIYGSVRIWDAATGQQRASLTPRIRPVDMIKIAPDGTWLATFGSDGRVRTWDAATGHQRASLVGHVRWHPLWWNEMKRHAITIAPDGTWLATMDGSGTVRIWDAATGQQRASLIGQLADGVAIAPDSTWFAVANGHTLEIWDPTKGIIRALMRADSPLRDCRWGKGGQSLIASGDNSMAGLYYYTFRP